MTEQEYAKRAVYKVRIDAPIDTVWSELIKTTSPRPFFWNSSWDTAAIQAGNAYRMLSSNGKTVGVIGEILELDPPHRLVTSFRLTNLDDPPSRVTYELKESGDSTEFSVITEQVLAGSQSEKSMASGSQFIVDNFKSYVETGKVRFGARIMLGLMGLMAPLAPKSMSADRWPLKR